MTATPFPLLPLALPHTGSRGQHRCKYLTCCRAVKDFWASKRNRHLDAMGDRSSPDFSVQSECPTHINVNVYRSILRYFGVWFFLFFANLLIKATFPTSLYVLYLFWVFLLSFIPDKSGLQFMSPQIFFTKCCKWHPNTMHPSLSSGTAAPVQETSHRKTPRTSVLQCRMQRSACSNLENSRRCRMKLQ